MGEKELSQAVQAKSAYNDILSLEVWAIRDYRSNGRAELHDVINVLEDQRNRSYLAMNEAFRAAGIGEWPWTSLDQLMKMAEKEGDELSG